jgi:hypothetical protein
MCGLLVPFLLMADPRATALCACTVSHPQGRQLRSALIAQAALAAAEGGATGAGLAASRSESNAAAKAHLDLVLDRCVELCRC